MPHRGRPVHEFLVTQGGGRVQDGIQERTLRVPGIQDVVVNFTWEPAWTINRVTAKARAALEIKSTMPPK
jgi:metal-sulfur cluster biosynthetic enzyme